MLYNTYKKDKKIEVAATYSRDRIPLIYAILPATIFIIGGILIIAWCLTEYQNDLDAGLFTPDYPYSGVIGGSVMITCGTIMLCIFLLPRLFKYLPFYTEVRMAKCDNQLIVIPHGLNIVILNPFFVKDLDCEQRREYGILRFLYDDGDIKKKYKFRITNYEPIYFDYHDNNINNGF